MAKPANGKLYDLAAASPLIAWYIYAIAKLAPKTFAEIAASPVSLQSLLTAGSQTVTILFLGLQILLFVIRRAPIGKAQGVLPRIAALIGSNLLLVLLAIPHAPLSPGMIIFSTGLVIIGTAGAIYAAATLGRGFSVFPQARTLEVSGPYRFVRHPIYLAEQIAAFGIMWQYAMPWSALIVLANFIAQFPRMHFEEQVLSKNFPAYRAYVACTARLIPGVY